MATLSKGHTFSGGETVTATKLNDLVDSATISNIVNADINASAAIAATKLASDSITNTQIKSDAAIALSKLATGALPTAITVASANIVDGTIVNADINASAAIADTKLATITTAGKVANTATTATNANTVNAIVARDASGNFSAGTITAALSGNASTVTTNANLTGDVTSVGNATSIASGVIVNADINATAAIAHSKLANITSGQVLLGNASNVPTATDVTGDVTISNTGVTAIGAGVIVNADVNASAAIALSKLATGALPTAITVASANIVDGTIVNADINASAAIDLSKLATGALPTAITVASANLVDGTIVNADINASAAIAGTKIAPNFGSQNIETTGSVSSGPGSTFTGSSSGDVLRITQTGAGNALVVEDSTNPDSTPFAIDATGTVVCGYTSALDAANALEVVGNSRREVTIYSYSDNLSLGYPALNLARSPSGSTGSATLLASNIVGQITFEANDGTDFIEAAKVFAVVDGTTGSGDMPGRLVFSTTPDGGATATERMRIDSRGNIGVGGTANAAAILDAASTTKGFLPPRMTTTQRDAISTPPAGLMIYNTTTNKLNVRTASSWEAVTSS